MIFLTRVGSTQESYDPFPLVPAQRMLTHDASTRNRKTQSHEDRAHRERFRERPRTTARVPGSKTGSGIPQWPAR
jgi:hypothetical protein